MRAEERINDVTIKAGGVIRNFGGSIQLRESWKKPIAEYMIDH